MALAKVINITLSMLSLNIEEGTELTTAQEVPSISVAATICEPAAVFTVTTFSPPAALLLLRESKTVEIPASTGSVEEDRFVPAFSTILLNRISRVSLFII